MNTKPNRGRGRPAKKPEDKQTRRVYVKLTTAEKEMVFSHVHKPSTVARKYLIGLARRNAKRDAPKVDQRPAATEPVTDSE